MTTGIVTTEGFTRPTERTDLRVVVPGRHSATGAHHPHAGICFACVCVRLSATQSHSEDA